MTITITITISSRRARGSRDEKTKGKRATFVIDVRPRPRHPPSTPLASSREAASRSVLGISFSRRGRACSRRPSKCFAVGGPSEPSIRPSVAAIWMCGASNMTPAPHHATLPAALVPSCRPFPSTLVPSCHFSFHPCPFLPLRYPQEPGCAALHASTSMLVHPKEPGCAALHADTSMLVHPCIHAGASCGLTAVSPSSAYHTRLLT